MKILVKRLLQAGLLLGMLLFATAALCQNGVIKGQVQHKGMTLEFITIKLNDAQGHFLNGTLSDEHGTFEFTHLEPGVYYLVGSYEGYVLQSRAVLGADAQVLITLSPSLFRWIPAPPPASGLHLLYTALPATGSPAV